MACEGLGHTSCADDADVHGDILLLRTCSYNEPGLPRQASETTGHSKPFRVFLTIPSHAELGMRGVMWSSGSCRVTPGKHRFLQHSRAYPVSINRHDPET